jgi:predicted ATPase/DNA-binding winged helix-turn-helix (wHTH) protein
MAAGVAAMTEIKRFQFDPSRRELISHNHRTEISGRAFEILELLIEARGNLVTKDEIITRIWPGAAVAENNLQVHISSLRKALGPDRSLIKTSSGLGYRLAGEWTRAVAGEMPANRRATGNIPAAVSELIGREDQLDEVASLLRSNRIVALVGPGGIGKTRLAVEVARRIREDFADGAVMAEFAPIAEGINLPRAVAVALGLQFAGGSVSVESLAEAVRDKTVLLVLDNCEHVIEAAARMTNELVRSSAEMRVLVTSRQPLWAEGEAVYKVPSLDLPADDNAPPENLARSSAIRLFLARSRALDSRLLLDAEAGPKVAAICRRLDGIPLAIELAAARSVSLGIDRVSKGLDDRFALLTGGHRTSLPRQQTLRATLDWSYDLLGDDECRLLRQIAIFAGGFSIEGATATAEDDQRKQADVAERLASLVAKSLVSVDDVSQRARYSLLETTRAYGLEKLGEGGEYDEVARRHAVFMHSALLQARTATANKLPPELLAQQLLEVDNVRAALDWAFSSEDHRGLAVELAASAASLLFELSFVDECRRRIEQALSAARRLSHLEPLHEMHLQASLGAAVTYTRGPTSDSNGAWTRLLALATEAGNRRYEASAIWGLWTASIYGGRPREALELADRFYELAAKTKDPGDVLMAQRMRGVSHHFLGEQDHARRYLEQVATQYVHSVHQTNTTGYLVDQGLVARAVLSRVLWLQGFPDQAFQLSQGAVEDAKRASHVMSRCYVLVEAGIAIALAAGKLEVAERHLRTLLDDATRHGLLVWKAWGRCYEARLMLERGNIVEGVAHLQSAINDLSETGFTAHFTCFLTAFAEGLCAVGNIDEGIRIVDNAIARCVENDERWCFPEVLRVKGDLIANRRATASAKEAEHLYKEAIRVARAQGAPGWELRASTSLALLRSKGGQKGARVRSILQPVCDRFSDGLVTTDVRAARKILDSLR